MSGYGLIGRLFNGHIRKLFLNAPNYIKPQCRHCTIRRGLLYVPGDDMRKLKKTLNFMVDCIIMDCEDGVALNKKDEARQTIRQLLDEGPVTVADPEWAVRVNPVQTPELCEADLEAVLTAKNLPPCICLPKVDNVDQLQWFAEKVWNILIKRPENDRGPLKFLMLIESPVAIMTLPELCKKAVDLATMAPLVPVGLILGGDDLVASLGAIKTDTNVELLYSRQKLVLVARAFGLQAIDIVFVDYKNQKEFKIKCEDSAILGFTGRQLIHPDQISVAQETFVPSRSKIKWAQRIVEEFKNNQEKGKGAFSFENSMVDMPTVRQAEHILKIARSVGKLKE